MSRMRALTEDDWNERFRTVTKRYTIQQYEKIFSYEKSIIEGIESATAETDLHELSSIDKKKGNFAIELLIEFAPEIVDGNPSKYSIFWRSRRLTSIRMRSWKDELLKQQDAARRNYRPVVIEKDEEGDIAEVGFWPPDNYDFGPNGLNPYQNDPEIICIRKNDRETFWQALSKLPFLERQYGPVYARISSLILSGEKVGRDDAELLGIPEDDVAIRVFECKKILKEMVAEKCPATAEKQRIAKNEKFPARELEKMTFQELKELYRKRVDIPPPVTIRDWTIVSPDKKLDEASTSFGVNAEDTEIRKSCDSEKTNKAA